jgi:hypothetical protein
MHDGRWGQVFITDARPERTKTWLQVVDMKKQADFFSIEQGRLNQDESV